jgi:predicted amidohydrolase
MFHLPKDEIFVNLTVPSGVHHFGDHRAGVNTSLDVGAAGRANYDMFVNWISEGAPCGRIAEAVSV